MKPTYRELTAQELQELEKEFIDFLILNGITADDWVRLKSDDKSKAEDLITLFSDVVFEGIMRKVSFLDYADRQEIRTFQCLEEKIIMMGINSRDPAQDLTDPNFIKRAMHKPPEGVRIFTSEKAYSKKRELELFEMTQKGCTISEGKLFKALAVIMRDFD